MFNNIVVINNNMNQTNQTKKDSCKHGIEDDFCQSCYEDNYVWELNPRSSTVPRFMEAFDFLHTSDDEFAKICICGKTISSGSEVCYPCALEIEDDYEFSQFEDGESLY